MSNYENLFITKLPRTLVDDDLAEVFATFHPRSAKVMRDPSTGRSKGFGFVLFNSQEEGKAAFDVLNSTRQKVRGQAFNIIMQPSKHNGNAAAAESRALYVRNIPLSAQPQEVEALFLPFGIITNFALRQDYHGNAVWVVFVEYETVDSAKAALQALHHTHSRFCGSVSTIMCKFAENEELKIEKKRQIQRQQQLPYHSHQQPSMMACAVTPPCSEVPPQNCDAFGDDDSGDASPTSCGDESINALSGTYSVGDLSGAPPTTTTTSSATPLKKTYRHNPYCLFEPFVLVSVVA